MTRFIFFPKIICLKFKILPLKLQVVNGYFVHFIAPQGLPAMPKDIIFVLDVSGSMSSGKKIKQLKKAMDIILSDMQEGDRFNILKFSSNVHKWQISMTEVSQKTISDARTFVRNMQPGGCKWLLL